MDSTIIFWKKTKIKIWKHFYTVKKPLKYRATVTTLSKKKLLSHLYWGAQVSMEISYNEYLAPMAIEKIKILGAVLELPGK